MREFIDLCFTPPAWIFTILMVPVAFYWLLSIFGSVADHFSHAGHAADGLHGDIGHGDIGHGDIGHGDIGHGDLHHGEVHHPGDLTSGHGDGNLAHGEGHATWGGLSFGEVPKVLSLSLLVFFGWTSSLTALWLYPPLAEIAERAIWIGAGLSAVAFGLAFGATAFSVRQINKLLIAGAGPTRSDLVGKLCTIKTQRVDAAFGQAEVDRASSLVQVRDPLGRGFRYGQRAVIYDYDSDREVFLIAAFDENLNIEIPGRAAEKISQPSKSAGPAAIDLQDSPPSSPNPPVARRGEKA